jgi:predicted TPR repeat methyltransferase
VHSSVHREIPSESTTICLIFTMRALYSILVILLCYTPYTQCFIQSFRPNSKALYRLKVYAIQASLKVDTPTLIQTNTKSIGGTDNDKSNQSPLIKSFSSPTGSDILFQFQQQTTGSVPRSYLPALLIFQSTSNIAQENAPHIISSLESALKWYFDSGGRLGRLEIVGPVELSSVFSLFGKPKASSTYSSTAANIVPNGYSIWAADAESIINHCKSRLQLDGADKYVLNDIIGRVYHDLGKPVESVAYYTDALQTNPSSSAALRNLGSAYQAIGNQKMAFASYQQALEVNPNDHLVFLKLAIFYEEFASMDWTDAADNAEACYRHYLANVDREDTAIMTRLGNLLVREHKSMEAIAVYNDILAVNDKLYNVWFNKAHAEIKVADYAGAAKSLERTLALEPSISAARHMLTALSEDKAKEVLKADETYAKDLYNSYAQTYDEHGKKLLYSAPRVIRQEMAKIYKTRETGEAVVYDISDEIVASPPLKKATMTSMGTCSDHPMEAPSNAACVDGTHPPTHQHDHSDCSSPPSSIKDRVLDVLDLGCGTGLSGAWLKDYAKSLVGVDIAEEMVKVAKKKQVYDELIVDSIDGYLDKLSSSSAKSFDLVVAAEVLSYIGDLRDSFRRILRVIRPGGHFVFSAETASDESELSDRGFKLLKNGRFGYSKAYLDALVAAAGEQYRIVM